MPYRPISARADGLLSLLGMKNLGRNPDLLNETVQPTLDAQGWYLRSSAIASQSDFVAAAAVEGFQAPFLLAAENEWLYVHYAFAQLFTGGGVVTASGSLVVFGSVGVNIFKTPNVPSVLAGGAGFSVSNVRDLWIPPRFGLLLDAYDLTPAVTNVRLGGLVSRVMV